MKAVSQASSDKLSTVEAELRESREREADLRAALDKAWAAEKEQARRAWLAGRERGARGKTEEGAKAAVEKAEEERDQGQREAMLLATQRQLQDSLTRAAHEASLREEALRSEVSTVEVEV